jgi:hypothetical protein
MESHDIREKNAVFRQRIQHLDSKLRRTLAALAKRNDQVRFWSRLDEDLQGSLPKPRNLRIREPPLSKNATKQSKRPAIR